ncbi:hypothetical protein [Mangrovicella endophytica]|uniref:hypothetical protein n=1 Tax=Mangrovicella endophytica TaxID=2066697 RepID=UPI000C9E967A|nr:hypothetical protein [Mangrovicella endophytica]
MKKLNLVAALLAAPLLVGAFVGQASAQATRTWVSGVGDDVNPCSRTAPCKTFAGAISKTAASGEINCLDPAGYGTVTITKSITIDCSGTFGSALSSATNGIIVNGADINVVLRGISINGAPVTAPGLNGIRYLQANSVLVDRVTINGFKGDAPNGFGVFVNNSTGTARLTLANSTITNNGSSTNGAGLQIAPTGSAAAQVTVANTVFSNNVVGVRADSSGTTGDVDVSIRNSSTSDAPFHGFTAIAGTGVVRMMLDGVLVANNAGEGVRSVGANSAILIGRSSVTNNGTGLQTASGGTIYSYGTNQVNANTSDGVAPTPVAQR